MVVVELVEVLVVDDDVVLEVEVRSMVVEGADAASREPDESEHAAKVPAAVSVTSNVTIRRGVVGLTPPFWPNFRPGGRD